MLKNIKELIGKTVSNIDLDSDGTGRIYFEDGAIIGIDVGDEFANWYDWSNGEEYHSDEFKLDI